MKKKLWALFAMLLALGITTLGYSQEISANEVEIHGFFSQGFMISSDNDFLIPTEDGSFEFNEMGINFSSQLTEELRFGLQLFSADLGQAGNNHVKLDWAYGDYYWKEKLSFRIGKMRVPYGFYNKTRDYDFLRPTILLPQSIYSEGMRSFMSSYEGFNLYGKLLSEDAGDLEYELFLGSISIDDPTSPVLKDWFSTLSGGAATTNESVVVQHLGGTSLQWGTPVDDLTLGGSFFLGNADLSFDITGLGATSIEIELESVYTLSGEYSWEDFTFVSEYSKIGGEITPGGVKLKMEGYYGQTRYRVDDKVELSYYYSEFFGNSDDKDGNAFALMGLPRHRAWQKDHAVSLSYKAEDNWVIKAEVHKIDGTAQVTSSNPLALEEDWYLYGLKATYSF